MSRALITVLKAGGAAVTERFEGRTWDYFVNVNRRLVNLDRIANSLDRPLAIDESPSKEMTRVLQVHSDHARPQLAEQSVLAAGAYPPGRA